MARVPVLGAVVRGPLFSEFTLEMFVTAVVATVPGVLIALVGILVGMRTPSAVGLICVVMGVLGGLLVLACWFGVALAVLVDLLRAPFRR